MNDTKARSLKEEAEWFRTLFEQSPIPQYLVDIKGIFIDGNAAATKLVGYTKEEIIGRKFTEIGLPSDDDAEIAGERLAINFQGENRSPSQYTLTCKNKTQVVVECWTRKTRINGKSLLLCTAINITAREELKRLTGLLPICGHCKKIRNDHQQWEQVEAYISSHSDARFSHGICPECAEKHYPGMDLYDDEDE